MTAEPTPSEIVHEFVPGDDDAPLLLLLHGTGAGEHDLLPLGRMLWPGAPLLAPRGWVDQGDGMPRFFTRIPTGERSAYPFTFDDADVATNVDVLAAFLGEAAQRHGVAERPVVAAGFSNGANLGGAALLLRPGLLRAAALFAPMPVLSEPPAADLAETAVFLGSGSADPIATPQHVETLAGWLDERGAAVEVAFHRGGHELPGAAVDAARAWITKLRAALGADTGSLP